MPKKTTHLLKRTLHNKNSKDSVRAIKSVQLVRLLVEEKAKNREWNLEDMEELGVKTGLNVQQVYKWSWEYDRKARQGLRIEFLKKRVYWRS